MSQRPTQQFVKGQTILLEGTPGDRAFRILSGEVAICRRNEEGALMPVAKLGPGEMFGEMYYFSPDQKRTASAIALSPTVYLEILFDEDLQDLMKQLPPDLGGMVKGLCQRLQKTSTRYITVAPNRNGTQLPDGTMKSTSTFIHRPIE